MESQWGTSKIFSNPVSLAKCSKPLSSCNVLLISTCLFSYSWLATRSMTRSSSYRLIDCDVALWEFVCWFGKGRVSSAIASSKTLVFPYGYASLRFKIVCSWAFYSQRLWYLCNRSWSCLSWLDKAFLFFWHTIIRDWANRSKDGILSPLFLRNAPDVSSDPSRAAFESSLWFQSWGGTRLETRLPHRGFSLVFLLLGSWVRRMEGNQRPSRRAKPPDSSNRLRRSAPLEWGLLGSYTPSFHKKSIFFLWFSWPIQSQRSWDALWRPSWCFQVSNRGRQYFGNGGTQLLGVLLWNTSWQLPPRIEWLSSEGGRATHRDSSLRSWCSRAKSRWTPSSAPENEKRCFHWSFSHWESVLICP